MKPSRLVHSRGEARPLPRPVRQRNMEELIAFFKASHLEMTWRPICVGEAQVWLLRSSAASVELGQLLVEVAAGGGAAVGEGGVRQQVRLLRAGEHVQHGGDLGPHTPADRE